MHCSCLHVSRTRQPGRLTRALVWFLPAIACGLFLLPAQAQSTNPWRGKRCAVSLTYDDAIQQHLDHALPALDRLGLRGTFYLSGIFPGFTSNLDRWRSVAKTGHELGNHTLFHPCDGSQPGREWVNPNYDLSKYTLKRITDEIRLTNALLYTIDGKTSRTFAYPCGDTKVEGVDYYQSVQDAFVGARGVTGEHIRIGALNPANVGSYVVSGQSAEQLIDLVKKAQETGTWVVFLFHGVGGGHSLDVKLTEHNKLLAYLKQNETTIWTAPFIEVLPYATQTATSGKTTRP